MSDTTLELRQGETVNARELTGAPPPNINMDSGKWHGLDQEAKISGVLLSKQLFRMIERGELPEDSMLNFDGESQQFALPEPPPPPPPPTKQRQPTPEREGVAKWAEDVGFLLPPTEEIPGYPGSEARVHESNEPIVTPSGAFSMESKPRPVPGKYILSAEEAEELMKHVKQPAAEPEPRS